MESRLTLCGAPVLARILRSQHRRLVLGFPLQRENTMNEFKELLAPLILIIGCLLGACLRRRSVWKERRRRFAQNFSMEREKEK